MTCKPVDLIPLTADRHQGNSQPVRKALTVQYKPKAPSQATVPPAPSTDVLATPPIVQAVASLPLDPGMSVIVPTDSSFNAPTVPEDEAKLVPQQTHIPAKQHPLDDANPLDPRRFPNQPLGKDTTPPVTIANVAFLLDAYGIRVRYNVIKKKMQIELPGASPDSPDQSDNADNTAASHIVSLARLNRMGAGPVLEFVSALGNRVLYNPVADWIRSKPWDRKNRLPAFYATLTPRPGFPEEFKERLMYRWALSAVAAVLKPSGFKTRGVLTLQGPQSLGKTRWVHSLVPDPRLADQVVLLNHHLDAGNKDSVTSAITHWVVEVGELDSSFKKDVARLKGFLTLDRDILRRPYTRLNAEYPRRTVFAATVNDREFLVDPTGNTRWWTIPVIKINYAHGIDMQQLYAQLAEDFENGEQWWLTDAEERRLEELNKVHRAVSAIRERMLGAIDLDRLKSDGLPAFTASELLSSIGIERPTNAQCKECAIVLRELCGESKRHNGRDKWRVPLLPLNVMNEDQSRF